MSVYKKLFLLIIIFAIAAIILSYVKGVMLYHPMAPVPEKYDRFYQKLLQLTESRNYVSNNLIKTSDGIFLDSVYIKNPDTNKCVIFFHGNAGNLSMRFDMIKFLYNYASVIIFDYRSFGKSTGETTNLSDYGLRKDADTIWNFAVEKLNIRPNNISLFGESLGCAIAIRLAADLSKTMDSYNYPHSLILNAPFYSLVSMMKVIFDKINIGFVAKLLGVFMSEYQSNEWIKYINHQTKIIIAHSPRDEIVPYNEGWRLYESIRQTHSNIKFVSITGTHNNLGLTDQYIYTLADLFND